MKCFIVDREDKPATVSTAMILRLRCTNCGMPLEWGTNYEAAPGEIRVSICTCATKVVLDQLTKIKVGAGG